MTNPDIIDPILIVLLKCVCFLIGYLTIRMGYLLINSGARGQFKFSATYNGIKGGLVSSSPGLLFVLLGVVMICYGMFVEKSYSHTKINNDGLANSAALSDSMSYIEIPNGAHKKDSLVDYKVDYNKGVALFKKQDYEGAIFNLKRSFNKHLSYQTAYDIANNYGHLKVMDSLKKYADFVIYAQSPEALPLKERCKVLELLLLKGVSAESIRVKGYGYQSNREIGIDRT